MAVALPKRWALNSQLLLAIQNNDVAEASKLFMAGVDTDTRFAISSNERPALCLSVENNDIEMAQLILGLGGSTNQKDSRGRTALHIASEFGFFQIVKLLLNNRADVHSVNKNGQTSLHLAAKSNNSDVVDLLINYGSNINKVDSTRCSPLHFASGAQSSIIYSLLNAGADPRVSDNYGNTVLHFQVDSFGTDAEGISLVANAYPWAVLQLNKQKKSPLHIAVGSDRKDGQEVLQVILNSISTIVLSNPPKMLSLRTPKGHTPLHLAVLERKMDLVRILVASGSEVDTKDELGRTPLDCAIRDNDLNIVALLLASGASIRNSSACKGEGFDFVNDDEIREMLIEFSMHPMKLVSLCRKSILRTWGPKFQTHLEQFPRTWRDFLNFYEI